MIKLLIQLGIFLIGGCIVFPLVFILGVIYTFCKHLYKIDYSLSKHLTPIVRSLTLIMDGLANAGGGEMLNDVFKIEGNIKYGRWDRTISGITGLLYVYIKDTKLRRILDKVLGKNHCVDAITEEDNFYYKSKFDSFGKNKEND